MDMTAYFLGRNAVEAGVSGEGLNIIEKVDVTETHLSKDIYNAPALDTAFGVFGELLDEKQEELVNGKNIKTINGESILGNGNLSIAGGNVEIPENVETTDNKVTTIDETSTDEQYPSAKAVYAKITTKLDKIVLSPDGSKWNIAVDNDGNVIAVKVEEEKPAISISLSENLLSFKNSASKTIVATLEPVDSTDIVLWTSSDESIAVVSNGVITPISNGSATITATAGSVFATCEITVNVASGEATTYTITRNITNAIGFDNATVIGEGSELLECYISDDECTMNGATATVTMDGEDITETAWDNGVVNIAEVTGDVVITLNAVKINFVTPPMEDFELQLHEGTKLLVKKYIGTEKAIAFPETFTYNNKEYPLETIGIPSANKAGIYYFVLNSNVEHLKSPFTSWFQGISATNTPNFRTLDGSTDYNVGGIQKLSLLEKLPTGSKDGNVITTNDSSRFVNCNSIRTLQNVVYSDKQTSLAWLYSSCEGLVHGGTIPAQITNISKLFFGCKNLRKVRIEGLEFTDTAQWASNVSKLELECYINSTLFKGMRYNPSTDWTFKDIDGTPINRILCFGDSLSEATYESKLTELCPTNAMVNSLGNGGNTSEQIYQKMVNGTYDKLLKSGVIVIWHGTNGYGVDGSDGVTAKMIEALDGNERYILIPPTSQGVGDSVYESWVATYGTDHVLSVSDWFETNGYTVADYLSDGTHFTTEGYELVAQAVYEKIQQYL